MRIRPGPGSPANVAAVEGLGLDLDSDHLERREFGQLSMSSDSASGQALRTRARSAYPYFLPYRTRWTDNDQYSHVNNSVYYHLFDSVVNTYLIQHAHLSPATSPLIGLVVSSFSHFFSPVSFPVVLDLGLRVTKIGSSSVTYEVAVFEQGSDSPSAVGGYTHVFVDRVSRKSVPIASNTREGLNKLLSPTAKL